MAKVHDMRTLNAVGAQALLGVRGIHVCLAIARERLRVLSKKEPTQFVIDMLERSETLKGPIWILSAGERAASEEGCDWEVNCQFGDVEDVHRVCPRVVFEWLDAVTVVEEMAKGGEEIGDGGRQRRWCIVSVKPPEQGVTGAIVEPHSVVI